MPTIKISNLYLRSINKIMSKPSILIVDDEKAARYGMRKILQKDNFVIAEAKDGADA